MPSSTENRYLDIMFNSPPPPREMLKKGLADVKGWSSFTLTEEQLKNSGGIQWVVRLWIPTTATPSWHLQRVSVRVARMCVDPHRLKVSYIDSASRKS